jgi:Ca2+-binding RTX toxin-like protein
MQFGNATFNLVAGTNASQTLNGTGSADILLGFGGNDTLNGTNGSDVLVGGAGNDTLNGGGGTDTSVFSSPAANYGFSLNGAGRLVVTDLSAGSPDGSDMLDSIEQVQFGSLNLNLVSGTNGTNIALNGSNGADLLLGLNGNDTLNGGGGPDVMVGGAGADRFVFSGANAANGDAITDFQALSEVGAAHDVIDVSGIDANGGLPGNGTFSYGGETAAFSARGQLIYYLDSGSGHYMLAGNTDASNATAEFQIDLGAIHKSLAAADFVL